MARNEMERLWSYVWLWTLADQVCKAVQDRWNYYYVVPTCPDWCPAFPTHSHLNFFGRALNACKASKRWAFEQPVLEKTLGSKWTSIPPFAGRKIVGPALVIVDSQRPDPKSGKGRLEELFTANLRSMFFPRWTACMISFLTLLPAVTRRAAWRCPQLWLK